MSRPMFGPPGPPAPVVVPWYRKPWVLVFASMVAAIFVLSIFGIETSDEVPPGQGQGDE